MSALTFTVPGPIVSANRASRIVAGRAVKSAEKRRDEQRVASIALAASLQARWKMPKHVAVEIRATNTRMDVDGLCKALLDGMEGIVYENDRYVLRLLVVKMKDKGYPEEYAVKVEAL